MAIPGVAGPTMTDTVGHYRLLDRIGTGGLGEVYRARDLRLGRTVAIKLLSPRLAADDPLGGAFRRDAMAAAALSHPGIATLFEVGTDEGRGFLVYEYVPGQTLRTLIASGPFNPKRAVGFAIQLADALAEANAHGVLHGDLKPDNVMVTPRGRAKLLDVGLARWTRGGVIRRHVDEHVARGSSAALNTLAYMSPEQVQGDQDDHRSDVFSLGAVLFEMLTGQSPFLRSTAAETVTGVMESAPVAPSSLNPNVPRSLDVVLGRVLSKASYARHGSAAALAEALRTVASRLEGRQAPVARAGRTTSGWGVPRKGARLWLALAVLAGLAATLWVWGG